MPRELHEGADAMAEEEVAVAEEVGRAVEVEAGAPEGVVVPREVAEEFRVGEEPAAEAWRAEMAAGGFSRGQSGSRGLSAER